MEHTHTHAFPLIYFFEKVMTPQLANPAGSTRSLESHHCIVKARPSQEVLHGLHPQEVPLLLHPGGSFCRGAQVPNFAPG